MVEEIDNGAVVIARVKDWSRKAPMESANLKEKVNVPVEIGVPKITPVDELSVKPGGRFPLSKPIERDPLPPEDAKSILYAWPI